jgi:DNA-binding NarL/FixJ family response regulator
VKDNSDKGCGASSVRILIADDHALIRTGLRMILQLEPDIDVVGEAKDGTQALELVLSLQPSIVLADITMPPPDGIELARLLRNDAPHVKTIIVTMHEELAMVRGAFAAGAAGYVIKRSGPDELINAIHTVRAGEIYVDPELRAAILG